MNELSLEMSIADVEDQVICCIGGVTEMEYPLSGIYVVLCDGEPGYDPGRFFRASHQRSVPSWVDKVGQRGIYVGSSQDVVQRLYHHLIGEGAQFTRVFPPVGILEIRKKSELEIDERHRKPMAKKESIVAEEYRNNTSDYVSVG